MKKASQVQILDKNVCALLNFFSPPDGKQTWFYSLG